MLQQTLILLLVVVLPSVEALISAQDPTSSDKTGDRVGIVRDVRPDPVPTNVTPYTRWRSFMAEAQGTFEAQPGVLLSEFIDLGCVTLGSQALAMMSVSNCSDLADTGGSRSRCTGKCAEHATNSFIRVSATTFIQGETCTCCLTDDVLKAAVFAEESRCNVACKDQDKDLWDLQPLQAQRRFSNAWACGSASDAWTAFRQFDGVSPLGRRGAYSPLFNAWYEVVVLPEDVLPTAAESEGSSTPSGQWMEFPGMAFYLHAVHAGTGWPIWSHQGRLSFVPECLHVDDRGRLMALARKNSRLEGVQPGFDALSFEMCGVGLGQPQVTSVVDGFDASITGCTFDIERSVLAFVAKPFGGQSQVSSTPRLVEIDVIRHGVTSRETGSLNNLVSLTQCRQVPGEESSPPSLAALVVSPGVEFTMVPPQTLASGAQALDSLETCGEEPGTDACKMAGPEREVVQLQAATGHATLPFMHVATEPREFTGAEFADEWAAQIAKIPCQPGGGQDNIWSTSVPESQRRPYLESPQSTFPREAKLSSIKYCPRSMPCSFSVEGVGVTGDDHLLAYAVSPAEATTSVCDRHILARSISAGGTAHLEFSHDEAHQRWTTSPVYSGLIFDTPGFHVLCHYAVPACTGNLTHAVFGGISGQNLGALTVMGPLLDQKFFCVAYIQCSLSITGWFFDEPIFAYLGQDGQCDVQSDGDPAGESWTEQPWQLHLANPAAAETRLDIPLAVPLAPRTICYCIGTQDPAKAAFLGRCLGPGQPFGNLSAAYPDTNNVWVIPGNFVETDPPSEFQFQGDRLLYSNRMVIIPKANPPEERPCRGENLDGRHWLKPTFIGSGFLVFRVHSLTPDAAFTAYGMPRDSLQLSEDGTVMRSSYLKEMEFHVCYTDESVPPNSEGLLLGTMILEVSICGDGKLRRPEKCDDGNTNSGDGCDEFCALIEPGWTMEHNNTEIVTYGVPDGPRLLPVCGDGLVRGSETCDDNNLVAGDGCAVTCAVEPGWTCVWEEGLLRSVCTPVCGDAMRIKGVEFCDDGNNVGGDGCSPSCIVENGFECQDGIVNNAELGFVNQEMSICDVACSDPNQIAQLANQGIYPCMDGLRPPETAEPHICQMYPRRCANMPFYNGDATRWLGCTTEVEERIKAQCSVIAKPTVVAVQYLRTGAGLDVLFSESARLTTPGAGQKSCDVVFAGASSVLGEGAACTQSSDTSMQVTLGGKATLRPGAGITLLEGAIYLNSEPIAARTSTPEWPANWPQVTSKEASLTAEFPVGGFEPLVAVMSSQPRLGLGADIELTASGSSGGGGNLAFSWGVKSITLSQIWLDGYYAGNTALHQQVVNTLKGLLQQALDGSLNQPVALVPSDVVIQMDTELRSAGGLLGQAVEILDPVTVTFSCTVTSNFDGQVQEATWQMELFQFAIPLVVRDSPASQTINRDQTLSLVGKVTAPAGLQPSQLPPFSLQWKASNINIGDSAQAVDLTPFVGQNPGVLTVPGLTFERGVWTFYLDCTYTAGTETSVITTEFQVTFEKTQPIAILDAPPSASAGCNTSLSGSRSYDPGFVIEGTKDPLTPLPNSSYKMEWRCIWLGQGVRVMTATEQILVGLEATAKTCEEAASIPLVTRGKTLYIPANAFAGSTVVKVSMRLVPVNGKTSAWVDQRIRFLDYVVPSVTFPQMPVSPLRGGLPHAVWALSISSLLCPQTGDTMSTLVNVGSGEQVPNLPNGNLPPVELVQSYQGLDSLPPPVKALVLANTSAEDGDPFAGQILNTYWLRVRAGAMTPGNKYRLHLHGDPGIWSVESPIMEANAGPVGGSLTVIPNHGQAVTTPFRLSAAGYEDPHIPLSYIFWMRALEDGTPAGELLVVSDWGAAASILVSLPTGNWTVTCRARDTYGMESDSALDGAFGPVIVDPVNMSSQDSIDRASTIADRVTDSSQMYGTSEAILDSALEETGDNASNSSDGRRLAGLGRRLARRLGTVTLDPGVAGALLNTLEKAQTFQVGTGSKSGATKQATILRGISAGIDVAPAEGTTTGGSRRLSSQQMAKIGVHVLGNAFGNFEQSEDAEARTGMGTDDAATWVSVSVNLIVTDDTAGSGGRRLRDLDVDDSTQVAGVVDGIGRALAQNQNSGGSSAPAKVEAGGLIVYGVPLTTSPAGSGSKVNLEGVGDFDISQEALANANAALAALGYEGAANVGISANAWKGNPFGASTQCTNGTSTDGGCDGETTQESALSNVTSMSLSGNGGEASKIENLQNPIKFVLTVGQDVSGGPPPLCMWWDTTAKSWSSEGCETLEVRNGGTEILCACTHLTSFGAFNDAGADVLASSNIDVLTDFSFESLQADNPTLWFVVSLFSCQLVWVCLGVWADNHGYSGNTDEQLKKIYFDNGNNAAPTTQAAEEQAAAAEAKEKLQNNQKTVNNAIRNMFPRRGANSPTEDLLHFRDMIKATLHHHQYTWRDLASKKVRERVHGICKDEIKHALQNHYTEKKEKEEGVNQNLRGHLLKAFRFELRHRLTKQMGRRAKGNPQDGKPKRRRLEPGLPTFPWTFSASLKLSCHGVHPLEDEPQVRRQLRVDEVLDVLVVADEYTVKVYIREGDFNDAECALEDPFLEMSWLTVLDHEGILNDQTVENPEENEEVGARAASRFEQRATAALALPAPATTSTSRRGVDTGAGVGDLCDEWEDEFLLRRAGGDTDIARPRRQRRHMAQARARRDAMNIDEDADGEAPSVQEYYDHVNNYNPWEDGVAAVVAPPVEDGDFSDVSDDESGSFPRLTQISDPAPADTVQEESRPYGFFQPLVDGIWGTAAGDAGDQAMERWEDGVLYCRTPRLAHQANMLGGGGRGLEFWRHGGRISEVVDVPAKLMRQAMMMIIQVTPPSEDGDMSWVTSGHYFSWAPLHSRELRRLQTQAQHAAAVTGRQGPQGPAKLEILLCGLEPQISTELQSVVPKLKLRAKEEEENTRAKLARERRRHRATSPHSSDEEEEQGAESDLPSHRSEEDEEEARIERLEARWEAPDNPEPVMLAALPERGPQGRRRPLLELDADPPAPEDVEGLVLVAIPDTNQSPMDMTTVEEDLVWSVMYLNAEEDVANLDSARTGKPAVLRFNDQLDGIPQPFTGWAVPMGRISFVRLVKGQNYPLPALGGASIEQVQLSMAASQSGRFDENGSSFGGSVFSDGGSLPDSCRELVELIVAPRDEALYRILVRPLDDRMDAAKLSFCLRGLVESWQQEEKMRKGPRLEELSRVGQLERQAEDLRKRAREAEHEARKDQLRRAERNAEDLQQIDDCIDLLFRRYEFILWDPFTLMRRVLMRDHPMTGIFVPRLRSFAVERALIFSCALAGSLMAAALFYDAGAGTTAPATNTTSTVTGGTTTTTLDTSTSVNPWDQILRQVWVSALSVFIAGIPAGLIYLCFKRDKVTEKLSLGQQHQYLRWWQKKRRLGYIISTVFLAFCYFFLWQFALNRPIDLQKDFTASSAINLVWKIVLKPVMLFVVVALLISTVKVSAMFDPVIFLIPFSMLDFTMFTAADIEDLLVYEQLVSQFFQGAGADGSELLLTD